MNPLPPSEASGASEEYYAAINRGFEQDNVNEVISTKPRNSGIFKAANRRIQRAETVYFETENSAPQEEQDDGTISEASSTPYIYPSYQKSAVSVKNACLEYSSKRGPTSVLKNFTMTVKKGTIYSLLGASGCGKTTLLSCVVGLKKLNSGDIQVLGGRPGDKASGVPGKCVGFMPQEIALFREFSIQESLRYYGRMYSMTSEQIEENIIFLVDFLNLPPGHRRISSLSGGQQRRVSFACSMIHNPELLILDEPTVGVDALLRQSIWDHLVKLVSTGKTTVIITTHYIEEARQSNTIGLMRSGKLLVEDNPNTLLKRFQTNLLEDIVMKLCLKDSSSGHGDEDDDGNSLKAVGIGKTGGFTRTDPPEPRDEEESDTPTTISIVDLKPIKDSSSEDEMPPNNWRKLHRASVVAEQRQRPKRIEELQDSYNRFTTMCYKNVLTLMRNVVFLTFIIFCPALQVVTVGVAIGNDPKGLKFAVVNNEVPFNSPCHVGMGCPLNENYTELLSCKFISLMDKDYVELIPYEDQMTALIDAKKTKVWGILTFPSNYTQSFKDRALYGATSELDSVYGSRIGLRLDTSNKQIEQQLSKDFYITTQEMMKNISLECGIEPVKSELPIFFDETIYGHSKMDFREYIAPSVLLGILFFFPVASSGLNIIAEKRMGTLDRSRVAGVTTAEFMAAYTTVQLIVLTIQASMAFAVMIIGFDIHIQGSFFLASAMALLVGIAGISIGFLLSVICSEEIQAVLLAMGMFFPNLLLAGMIWPLQGMSKFLQYFAYSLPCTLACEAMRSVVSRGVGLSHISVWPGFLTTICWIIIYWILFLICHKIKLKK